MDMEDSISYVLRAGVMLSAILIIIGVALDIAQNQAGGFSFMQITSQNPTNSLNFNFTVAVGQILSLNGTTLIFLGFIVLIATPVVRVAMSIFYFSMERNYLYTVITAIVMADLMVAIFIVPQIVSGNTIPSAQSPQCPSCWGAYSAYSSLIAFLILFAVGIGIILIAMRMDGKFAPRRLSLAPSIALAILWIISMLLALSYFASSFQNVGQFVHNMNPIFPFTTLFAICSFAVIAYVSRRHGIAWALLSGLLGAISGTMVFELPFMIITLPLSGLGGVPGEMLLATIIFAALTTFSLLSLMPSFAPNRRSVYALGLMFIIFAAWAIEGFTYPSTPIAFLLNCASKMVGFIVVVAMFLPASKRK